MINIIPQSEVRLLKTPLEKDSEHTLSFNSLQYQTAYFLSKVQKTYTDFTYVRDNQTIVVDGSYDSIYTCNYLMYKNNGFNNKYFYAFITKMEYVSENSTRIYFEIDSLQTWYFQINYNSVFIEREHVSDDTIGKHTIPENLETGEYVCLGNGFKTTYGNTENCWLCLTTTGSTNGYMANGQYTGLSFKFFKDNPQAGLAFNALNEYINQMTNTDEIVSIFPIPKALVEDYVTFYPIGSSTDWQFGILTTISLEAFNLGTFGGAVNPVLGNNYVPRNNKLLTYPYRYMYLTNNVGGSNIYKIENFSGNPSFTIRGMVSISCGITCHPNNYKNVEKNFVEALPGAKFPVASWTTDVYTNWLTQNGINKDFANIVSEGDIQLANFSNMFGLTSFEPSHVLGNVFGSMQEIYNHQKAPDSAKGNVTSGDIMYSLDNCNYTLLNYVIKEEYAKSIDSYFDVYGYKVNEVKIPNFNTRRNWNYIKTIGCDFTGEIPQEDLQKIKNIFNNGITFWHNANNFLNYTVNNDII